MRRKFICGNWKMHGGLAANDMLLAELSTNLATKPAACDVAVCVPFPYLGQCHAILKGVAILLGAQDVSCHAIGAYTGEVSAAMLHDLACRYVIVGHSERRLHHHEDDALVARKALAAVSAGLIPIVCVGETLQERDSGNTNAVVVRQLTAVLNALDVTQLKSIVLAYEPVWAIGTGKTATPEMAQEVHSVLRARLGELDASLAQSVQILYGGSMKPDNAKQLLGMPDIDGGLIGGAALKAEDFLAIIHAV